MIKIRDIKLEKDITCSFYPFLMNEYSKNAKGQIYFLTLFAYFNQCAVQVFKNASNFIGFWAVKDTFWQTLLNYDIEMRCGATKNALGIEIMFTKY